MTFQEWWKNHNHRKPMWNAEAIWDACAAQYAARIAELEAQAAAMREALLTAYTDIGDWQSLARRQYAEMPHNAAVCPTQMGIDHSDHIRKVIGDALASSAGRPTLAELERLRSAVEATKATCRRMMPTDAQLNTSFYLETQYMLGVRSALRGVLSAIEAAEAAKEKK